MNVAKENLLRDALEEGIIIFGAGQFARDVAKAAGHCGIRVRAFAVSRANPLASVVDGLPVRSVNELSFEERQMPFWIGIFNREAHSDYREVAKTLQAHSICRVHSPMDFFHLVADEMGWRYWLTPASSYDSSPFANGELLNLMDDEASRNDLMATIDFRQAGSLDRTPLPCTEPQYFPDFFIKESHTTCFIDAGAYDGTTIGLAKNLLRFERAIAFEPDPDNFRRLVAWAESSGIPVTCIPCGLSDQDAFLPYRTGEGESSAIVEASDNHIHVVALDDCLHHKQIDFIKFDVEGHELRALTGAEEQFDHIDLALLSPLTTGGMTFGKFQLF